MSVIEGVSKLAANYEDIAIQHTESRTTANDHELKLKESEDKMKRLALTVRKLQTVRSKLQQSLEATKEKLKAADSKSEQYHKSLQTIHAETQRSLEKWKVFMNEAMQSESRDNTPNVTETGTETETDSECLKRCLSDVRSVTMYFIQSLDMYRENAEQHEAERKELDGHLVAARAEIEKYKEELQDATQHIASTDNSQMAKNAHIEKLTAKLNHSIQCMEENWHREITKADFVDLTVSTRLMLSDTIWCLIRWRHKNSDKNKKKENESSQDTKKYHDEYFWSSQSTYLSKVDLNISPK